MKAMVHEVSSCALQCIRNAADTICNFPSAFDAALKQGHNIVSESVGNYGGKYFTATMVVLTSDHANHNRAVEKLKERGFKLVATFPGAHPNGASTCHAGEYLNELWVLGMTPVKETP